MRPIHIQELCLFPRFCDNGVDDRPTAAARYLPRSPITSLEFERRPTLTLNTRKNIE